MPKKKNVVQLLLIIAVALFQYLPSYSQNYTSSFNIIGTVADEFKNSLPYASIAIYNSGDSALITGVTTNNEGLFTLPIKPGSYYLKLYFLSYQTKTIPNIIITNKDIDLGEIVLKTNTIALAEVEIKGTKSQVELKLDKRVYNVGQDITNVASNASEILENVPSVAVDVEGNVSLRGSENVRILINGKQSGMVGVSSADALRQLQGNLIQSIEVISNPASRYDSEGEVGIINIVLKKERDNGLNGSYELTAGYPDRYSGSFNLNYKKDKINFFTNYGFTYRKTPGSGSSFQQFYGDSAFAYERIRNHTRGGMGHNARFGVDFLLNKYNTLTVALLYKNDNETNNATLIYKDLDANNSVIQTLTRTDEQNERDNFIEGELNYSKTFEEKGREWNTSFKIMNTAENGNSNILQQFDNGSIPINQKFNNTEKERNLLFQTDYIKPINKHGKFETGLKSSLRTIENNYVVSEQDSIGSYFVLNDFDNQFVFQENIYAGYLIYGNKIKKLSYQAGMRAELSDISTELLKTNELNKYTYLNFFPSTHFSYLLDSSNTLQLSYSRRLSRPSVRNLLPLFTYSDSRNLYTGNPNLQPEYTNSFELGHLKYLKNGSFLSTIYYRHTTNVVQRITVADSTGITQRLPINLAEQNAFGLEFNLNLELKKYWKINTNFNFFRALINGNYLDQNFDVDLYSMMVNASSKLTIKKKVDFQTTLHYHAPRKVPQGSTKSIYAINLGLSKEVLNKKGTLTFSVKDLFNTRKRRSITETPGFYSESTFQWSARQFLVTFNYRINQKNQSKRQSKSSDYSGGGGDGDF